MRASIALGASVDGADLRETGKQRGYSSVEQANGCMTRDMQSMVALRFSTTSTQLCDQGQDVARSDEFCGDIL
jgi:hypothetical protein